MKTDNIIETLDRLNRDYPLKYVRKGDEVHFTVEGITDEFWASILADECIVSTKDWHEHFSTLDDMEAFMKCLFIGKAEIILTYRGDKPVSHRTQIVSETGPQVVSRTGAIFFPFWKSKTQRKKAYKIATPNVGTQGSNGKEKCHADNEMGDRNAAGGDAGGAGGRYGNGPGA